MAKLNRWPSLVADVAKVNWLAEHAEDADIDLPLLKPPPPAPVKPKMSVSAATCPMLLEACNWISQEELPICELLLYLFNPFYFLSRGSCRTSDFERSFMDIMFLHFKKGSTNHPCRFSPLISFKHVSEVRLPQ